jgi:hypothetical protein
MSSEAIRAQLEARIRIAKTDFEQHARLALQGDHEAAAAAEAAFKELQRTRAELDGLDA